MHKTILLYCQTKNSEFCCEDCIAYKNCELANKQKNTVTIEEI